MKIIRAIIIFGFIAGGLLSFVVHSRAAIDSGQPGAIAVEVRSNSTFLSPEQWYQKNVSGQGAPQSVEVNGYQGVRDGRTVYVSAANVADDGKTYVNIYILSYTQKTDIETDNDTQDVFGQILQNFKFNTNLGSPSVCSLAPDKTCSPKQACAAADGDCVTGICSGDATQVCLLDSDCPDQQFCDSLPAKLRRDVLRLADLQTLNTSLNLYAAANGFYPKLQSGSYLPQTTMSVWPSWQMTFGAALGASQPVDAINKLGTCSTDPATNAKFDPLTCWDDKDKTFADSKLSSSGISLPAGSLAYLYQVNAANNFKSYHLCAVMESGLFPTGKGACAGSAAQYTGVVANHAPTFLFGGNVTWNNGTAVMTAKAGSYLSFFLQATDPDGDDLSPLPQWQLSGQGLPAGFALRNSSQPGTKELYSTQLLSVGTYNFTVTVKDRLDGEADQLSTGQALELVVK